MFMNSAHLREKEKEDEVKAAAAQSRWRKLRLVTNVSSAFRM